MKGWQKKYGVSLKFPNNCISISKEQSVERIQVYLKNIWSVCRYFLDKFGIDPPIINGDQMSLHRNESSGRATLSFRNQDTFVKENHHLSRERITVFTQVSNDTKINLIPEFVFKRTGKRPPLPNALLTMKYRWSPKGSHRLEYLLCTIENLPNRFNMFSHTNFAIYVLGDYVVHLMPEVKGYMLIIIGGGITGFVQVNDTHLHKQLKTKYHEIEKVKMLEKLVQTPNKIPTPNQSEMIQMLHQTHADCKIDVEAAFKSTWATDTSDGSEDYKVSDRIMYLVGPSMREFRLEMMSKPYPNTIQRVIKQLIPSKGVKRANDLEGSELFDGDGIEGKAAESESEDEREPSWNLLEVIDPSGEIPMEDSWEPKHDTLFLEKIQKVLDGNKTSSLFLPYRSKLIITASETRRSIKKRMSKPRNRRTVTKKS
uniref:Uncharacterized protein n=1 Tax=Octopus bimaculoides TaxID=37653 RepID=A0A0L8FFZ7_OCTBM